MRKRAGRVAQRAAAGIESRRDRRRFEIISAARRIVAKRGVEALTVSELEARLHYTRGVITYHFSDMDEVVAAVFRSAIDEIDAATSAEVGASASPAQALRAIVHANVHGFLAHVEATRILLSFWGRLAIDRRFRKLNRELYATYRARTASLLRLGHAAGAFRAVDVDDMAALIVGIVIGVVAQSYFDPRAVDPAALIDEAAATLLARLASPR